MKDERTMVAYDAITKRNVEEYLTTHRKTEQWSKDLLKEFDAYRHYVKESIILRKVPKKR